MVNSIPRYLPYLPQHFGGPSPWYQMPQHVGFHDPMSLLSNFQNQQPLHSSVSVHPHYSPPSPTNISSRNPLECDAKPGPPINNLGHGVASNASGDSIPPTGPPGANLFVFHIPNGITNDDILRLFAPYGDIISLRIQTDQSSGKSRGFGFVSYSCAKAAEDAIAALNGYTFFGKRLKVELKKPRAASDPLTSESNTTTTTTPPPTTTTTLPASDSAPGTNAVLPFASASKGTESVIPGEPKSASPNILASLPYVPTDVVAPFSPDGGSSSELSEMASKLSRVFVEDDTPLVDTECPSVVRCVKPVKELSSPSPARVRFSTPSNDKGAGCLPTPIQLQEALIGHSKAEQLNFPEEERSDPTSPSPQRISNSSTPSSLLATPERPFSSTVLPLLTYNQV